MEPRVERHHVGGATARAGVRTLARQRVGVHPRPAGRLVLDDAPAERDDERDPAHGHERDEVADAVGRIEAGEVEHGVHRGSVLGGRRRGDQERER